jgi:methylthioribulose-1-phosphate dehydratase
MNRSIDQKFRPNRPMKTPGPGLTGRNSRVIVSPMKSEAKPLETLLDCGRQFYERQWMWGSAGNLSLRLKDDPLTIAITPSGLNKGHMKEDDLIVVEENSPPHPWPQRPRPLPRGERGPQKVASSDTLIHQAIYRSVPGAGAVFHVHPMYSTLLSAMHGNSKQPAALKVGWFEMMRGVGVGDEEESEIAILPNWKDISRIAGDVAEYIRTNKNAVPAVLLYNHGLIAWGITADKARNHLEIIEYVCQFFYLKRLVNLPH